MKKVIQMFCLLSLSYLDGQHQNLIIFVDGMQQENVKKEDITVTHQLIIALQQKAASILVSASLWNNIAQRKKYFIKKLQNLRSHESAIYNLYQATNDQLKKFNYDIFIINQILSISWFKQKYPELASLSQSDFDQLKFNFLCYMCVFDMNAWSVYDAQTGMLLLVPQANTLQINDDYKVIHEKYLTKHIHKKNNVVQSMQSYFKHNQDEWIVYLSGHGHQVGVKQKPYIAGMLAQEFSEFLNFLNNDITIKLLVYSCCYGGGVHTVEPYKNIYLNYPVIVVALTDAPIYGFGFFEGIKLPPYSEEYQLELQDVQSGCGLILSDNQKFDLFFKRAWDGFLDMNLVEMVSQFFKCDIQSCSLYKIENIPLLRKKNGSAFFPIQDETLGKLVQQVVTSGPVIAEKPLLVYVKKIEQITLTETVPFISLLPGVQNHEIGTLVAHNIPLSKIINTLFLSLSEAEKNKNYLIHKIFCHNDLVDPIFSQDQITHFMLIQQGLRPKFCNKKDQVLITFKLGDDWYFASWHDGQCLKIITLTLDQITIMRDIENLMQSGVDFQADLSFKKLVEFDAYVENKIYQQDIVTSCLHHKICKKW